MRGGVREAGGSKAPRLTRFRTGDTTRDSLLDLVYGLHDTLVQGVTERQRETIDRVPALLTLD